MKMNFWKPSKGVLSTMDPILCLLLASPTFENYYLMMIILDVHDDRIDLIIRPKNPILSQIFE